MIFFVIVKIYDQMRAHVKEKIAERTLQILWL